MGILRSLGALGRAVGPIMAASGKCYRLALRTSWQLRGAGQEKGYGEPG